MTKFSPQLQPSLSADLVRDAVVDGTRRYFDDCRQRVPWFVTQHFNYPGCWHTNKVAFGFDVLRAPLNLFWSPVYTLLSLIRYGFKRFGFRRVAKVLEHVPAGFTTSVQKQLAVTLYSELLKLDCEKSRLQGYIVESLERLYSHRHGAVDDDVSARLDNLVHEALMQYRVTRTASSDITNTITSSLIGAFAFYKFTPGGIGVGIMLSALLAKYFAAKEFFLGEGLGNLYYALLPPEPNLWLTVNSMLAVMTLLSVFASFSGLIADPVQAIFRLHHKRLYKMIDHLEQDFLREEQGLSSFRPKDQYVARLLDLFDVVKSHIHP